MRIKIQLSNYMFISTLKWWYNVRWLAHNVQCQSSGVLPSRRPCNAGDARDDQGSNRSRKTLSFRFASKHSMRNVTNDVLGVRGGGQPVTRELAPATMARRQPNWAQCQRPYQSSKQIEWQLEMGDDWAMVAESWPLVDVFALDIKS